MRPLLLGLLSSAAAATAALSLSSAAQAAPQPDLSLATSCAVNGPQSALCTITVTNVGNLPSGSPLHLADTITGAPSNGQFTGGGGTLPIRCSPGAGPILPISCNANASLAPGQSKNALFSFHLPTGGSFTNCVTVSSAGDAHPANNTNICTSITVPGPGGCTGYPMVADVFFYNPMTPFGPQTVNICRGGHVVFHNVSTGIALTIQDLTSPGGQSLFPSITLASSGSGATIQTVALQTGSPPTYEYKISGFVVHGHIIVH